MRNPLSTLLAGQALVVLDGALATELEARGVRLDDALWSARILIEQPELIRQLHYDYFVAGADVAITSSYQATYAGFAARTIGQDQATALLQRSVALAREARSAFWAVAALRLARAWPLVAASIGPYGAYLADGSEYRGDYSLSVRELQEFHVPRMRTLAQAGADLLACETIPCLAEAHALIQALDVVAAAVPDCPPAWISFACRNGAELNSGESFGEAVAVVAQSPHVVAVGVNCTAPAHVRPLLEAARSVTDKFLLVYPNRGERWDARARRWVADAGAPGLADYADEWRAAGASGIGGCCRFGPDDIRALAAMLRGNTES